MSQQVLRGGVESVEEESRGRHAGPGLVVLTVAACGRALGPARKLSASHWLHSGKVRTGSITRTSGFLLFLLYEDLREQTGDLVRSALKYSLVSHCYGVLLRVQVLRHSHLGAP